MSEAAHAIEHHEPVTSTGIPNKKVLMWAFLGSDCMFFGTLISTHLIYRKISATVGGNYLDIRGVFDIELTSFSTFILLASSLFMALAVSAIHKGNLSSTRWMIFGTIVFGAIFLACQVYEFTHFVHAPGMNSPYRPTVANRMSSGRLFTCSPGPTALTLQSVFFGYSGGSFIPSRAKCLPHMQSASSVAGSIGTLWISFGLLFFPSCTLWNTQCKVSNIQFNSLRKYERTFRRSSRRRKQALLHLLQSFHDPRGDHGR